MPHLVWIHKVGKVGIPMRSNRRDVWYQTAVLGGGVLGEVGDKRLDSIAQEGV